MRNALLIVTALCLVCVAHAEIRDQLGTVDEDRFIQYAEKYEYQGVPILAGFVPNKTDYVAGEPIFLTFVVKNVGDKPVECPTYGSSQKLSICYSIKAWNEKGQPVDQPKGGGGSGVGSGVTLKPQEAYADAILLSNQLAPLKPGKYTLECRRYMERQSRPFPKVITRLSLVVGKTDSQVIGDAITRLGKLIRAEPPKDEASAQQILVIASQALSSIEDSRTVPYLLESLRCGGPWNWPYAIEGLAKYPSPGLVGVFEELLTCPEYSDVRSEAISALGSFKCPEAVELLVGLLDEAETWIKRYIVISLGKMEDRSVIPRLQALRDDKDPVLAVYAIQALEGLGEVPELSWYEPILASGNQGAAGDAVRSIAKRFGKEVLPYLAGKLNLHDPGKHNLLNYTLVREIARTSGEQFEYLFDFQNDGTAEERAQNEATMKAIQVRWPPNMSGPER